MIDEISALIIARETAAAEGWAFVEPAHIQLRRGWTGRRARWEIRSNVLRMGPMARFVIDANDGRVIEKGYIPR